MKVVLVFLTLIALLAASTLPAVAVTCPGCTGASTCPPPSPCPAIAIHVALVAPATTGSSAMIQKAITKSKLGDVVCVEPSPTAAAAS